MYVWQQSCTIVLATQPKSTEFVPENSLNTSSDFLLRVDEAGV